MDGAIHEHQLGICRAILTEDYIKPLSMTGHHLIYHVTQSIVEIGLLSLK